MQPIIDAHIHLYPPEVYTDPRKWGAAHNEPWWTHCVAPLDKPTIQGWATVRELLRHMDAAGVDRVVLLGWYWEHQATCDLQNRWFVDWVRAHPDRISGFATAQPTAGQAALDGLERALDAGLCGIGELKAPAQGFSFTDENWAAVADLARRRELPINLHVTDPVSIPGDASALPTPLADFVELVTRFPENCFILAHWGGGLPFYELNPRIRRLFRNVFYDTAASPLLYDCSVYRRLVDIVGAGRVLFGSDYPLLTHPRETSEPEFARSLRDAAAGGLTPDESAALLGGNMARILGLS